MKTPGKTLTGLFYLKVVNAQIIFNINEQAAVESLTLFQNGQKTKGKKID